VRREVDSPAPRKRIEEARHFTVGGIEQWCR
jgi:hypothetical protein